MVEAGTARRSDCQQSEDRPSRGSENDIGGPKKFRFLLNNRLSITLIVTGLVIRMLFLVCTPTFYAPDEASHFAYLQHIAVMKNLPVHAPGANNETNDYEYHQPPVYYIALAPIYLAGEGLFHNQWITVRLLRLSSIIFWLLTIFCLCRYLIPAGPGNPSLQAFILGMFCLLPTYSFISSTINNDNLAILGSCAVLSFYVKNRYGMKSALLAGVMIGVTLLTKMTAVGLPFIILGDKLVDMARSRSIRKQAFGYGAAVAGIVAAFWLPWGVRNYALYGSFFPENTLCDPHYWNSILHLFIGSVGFPLKTFWAVAGKGNNISGIFPVLGAVLTAFSFAGIAKMFLARNGSPMVSVNALWIASLFGIAVQALVTLRFHVLYGCAQGRYFFPFLFPISLWLGVGLWSFRRFREHATPNRIASVFILYAGSFAVYTILLLRGR